MNKKSKLARKALVARENYNAGFAAGRQMSRNQYSSWYINLPSEVKQVIAAYQREQYDVRQAQAVAQLDHKITFDFSE